MFFKLCANYTKLRNTSHMLTAKIVKSFHSEISFEVKYSPAHFVLLVFDQLRNKVPCSRSSVLLDPRPRPKGAGSLSVRPSVRP